MKKTILIVLTTIIFTMVLIGCGEKSDSQEATPTPDGNTSSVNPSNIPSVSAVVTEAVVSKLPEENVITPMVTNGVYDENEPTGAEVSGTPLPTSTVEVTKEPEEWRPRDERFTLTPAPGAENCPEGVGNIKTPRGSGGIVNLPNYRNKTIDNRVYSINIWNTRDDYYVPICNTISEYEGVEDGPVRVYYCDRIYLEANIDDVNYSYLKYLRNMYPENFIGEDTVRIPITIYTYEGCDEFVMYHEYASNYQWEFFSEDEYYLEEFTSFFLNDPGIVYNGLSTHLIYAAGDKLKLVDYAYIGENYFGEVIKKIYFEATLDDYRVTAPEWFLEKAAFNSSDAAPLALIVPYDYYMDNFDWSYDGIGFYCAVKCKSDIENPERWVWNLTDYLTSTFWNTCTVSPSVFFEHDLRDLVF